MFPNASGKLKESFVRITSLLNIEAGTEEAANALIKNDCFPEQKLQKIVLMSTMVSL